MAILLWGVPEGDDFTWDFTYKFHSEEGIIESTGYTTGFAKYSNPTRELKFSLGTVGQETFERLSSILDAGASLVTVPMWFFRASLMSNVNPGDSEILVDDSSEFYPGEQALLMRADRPSICELLTISNVAGSTVYVTPTVANDYSPTFWNTDSYNTSYAFLFPLVTGVLEYEGLDFISGLPGLGVKAKVDGGVWNSFVVPSVPSFSDLSMEAKYNTPKIVRDLCGVENGIISMYAHGSSSKLTFECTWHFKDSNWKSLRDLFFAVRGKAESFNISTNMYEVVTTRGADQGTTTIYLSEGYQYIRDRFPYLLMHSRRTGRQFVIHVTAHVYRDEFSCEALDYELYDGDRACFYPAVRFESDDLTFSFKGKNMCFVKATFIEEPS